MNPSFIIRIERDALIVSFPAPARTLSWAVVNGGFCHADHIINHHVSGSDRLSMPDRSDGWKKRRHDWSFKARSWQWRPP